MIAFDKDYYLTPEEGRLLCIEARASVEYGLARFPEVDLVRNRWASSEFHNWAVARNDTSYGIRR